MYITTLVMGSHYDLLSRHLIWLCFLSMPILTFGQDIHFSHIHASPTHFNPAMMGMFKGEIRLIANYKSQWQTFDKGFSTFAGSVDGKIAPLGNSNILAGGLQFYADKAGDLSFSTNNIAATMSIIQALDRKQKNLIAIGFQNAYTSQSFKFNKIIAFDEEIGIDGAQFNNKINYFDLSAGIGWFNQYSRSNSFHFGAAAYHINKPSNSFFEEDKLGITTLYRKLVLHGGGDFKLNRYSSLKPSFIFMKQGSFSEITFGSFWKFKPDDGLHTRSNKTIYFGVWSRVVSSYNLLGIDALIGSIRYDYENLILTLTFDFNISKLGKISAGAGGPELSVIQTFAPVRKKKKKYKVKCPDL